jgi:hypothetical protein
MRIEAIQPSGAASAPGCLGCRDCMGLCRAIIELVGVPEAVLAHQHAR